MKKGFTLIELSIAVIIAAIAVYSLLTVFITAATENVDIESLTMALYLANGRLEELSGRGYDGINSVASTPFAGAFGDFNSEVMVDYVSSEALDVPIAATTEGYRRVKVRVFSSALSLSVEVTTLVTDVSNE